MKKRSTDENKQGNKSLRRFSFFLYNGGGRCEPLLRHREEVGEALLNHAKGPQKYAGAAV
jgi:hypothetical protein